MVAVNDGMGGDRGHGEFYVARKAGNPVNKALSSWKELTAPRPVSRTGIPASKVLGMERVALVFGGGSGMGEGAARRLAADGFRLGVLSTSGKGEALGRELGGIGVTGSNQTEADIGRLVAAAMGTGPDRRRGEQRRTGPRAPLLELSDADWHRGMEVYFPERGPGRAGRDAGHAGRTTWEMELRRSVPAAARPMIGAVHHDVDQPDLHRRRQAPADVHLVWTRPVTPIPAEFPPQRPCGSGQHAGPKAVGYRAAALRPHPGASATFPCLDPRPECRPAHRPGHFRRQRPVHRVAPRTALPSLTRPPRGQHEARQVHAFLPL